MALDSPPRRRSLALALLPLSLVFLAVGLSTAVVGPFLALFLSTSVHAGPVKVTVFLVAAPLAGVTLSTALARFSDRRAIRRRLLIAAATAGMIGTSVTAFVRDYWILLALAVTATALAGSLFPQTFAYARQVLTRDSPGRAAMGISSLRTVFSLAWVAGPPFAAVLLSAGGFRYVYLMAAAMYALAALVAILWLDEVAAPAPVRDHAPVVSDDRPDSPRWTLWLTVVAFTLSQAPLTLGVQALPLLISRDLGGRPEQAGLLLGLCAFLEIPLMLGLGWLTTRVRLRAMVLAGAGCGVAYQVLATTATGVGVLAAGQLFNALFIASVSGLGITYMQDMLPRHPGRATTLFTNSFPIGAVLAGPLFGLSQHFGFRLAFGLNAALCAAGLLLLLMVKPQPKPAPE
ncbi:MAG: transporter, family, sugar efflux transporter [Actinoplanes sp.]|jgi:SET family sugar efflux transporter-like MFS transporter|nr:transporter, family, sugar efflux transporter [Actinoplanes sp.]